MTNEIRKLIIKNAKINETRKMKTKTKWWKQKIKKKKKQKGNAQKHI